MSGTVVTGSPPRFLVFTATDSDALLPELILTGVQRLLLAALLDSGLGIRLGDDEE